MIKKKQVEEMMRDVCKLGISCDKCNAQGECVAKKYALRFYNAGYRKQSEGEWIGKTDYAGYGYYCSNCNAVFTGENAEWIAKEHYYCPKCGAKMKGGVEE